MTNSEQLLANNERINAATELLKTKAAGTAVEVYDGLDSDSTTAALSANQGKVLDEKIPTDYGADLDLSIDSSTYVITAQLKDKNGAPIGTAKTIDLPLESVVVSGAYDKDTKEVVLTLKDNSKIKFSVADLVDGLASSGDLSNYLPKVINHSDYPVAYVTANGIQKTIEVSWRTLPEGSIAMRDGAGQVKVATPNSDTSAANKKYVDDAVATKVNTADVVNGLTSTETAKPLSAMQGKVLNDQLNSLVTEVGNVKEKADKIAVKYLKGAEVQGKSLVLVDQDGSPLYFYDTPDEYLVRATVSDNKLTLVKNTGGATVFEGGGAAPTFLFDPNTRTLTIITG